MKDVSKTAKTIVFSFENHDSIFDTIEAENLSNSNGDDIEFDLRPKLFREVLLRHSRHHLFEETKSPFAQFMKKLKST